MSTTDAPKVIVNEAIPPQDAIQISARQLRRKNIIHPYSIVVTNKQILLYKPKWIGYEIESLDYTFIQDISAKTSRFASAVYIKTMTSNIELGGLPRDAADRVSRAIRDHMEPKKTF